MSYPATDPEEWVGTPEWYELQADREAKYIQYLDLMAEEQDDELVQWPQRFSH
jgi:hypothetical protein